MLLHIQLTAYEAIRKLPENLRKTVGAEFVATEELFAAFFMDEDEGREEWNKMPEDCKLEYNWQKRKKKGREWHMMKDKAWGGEEVPC